ncbi:MAG: hypothetical protein ACE149_16340 [Armatimonadota bacterium]
MREKIVLVGAGSVVFTRNLIADILALGQEMDLALVDISADALAVAEGLAKKMVSATGASVRLRASTDRREVFPGATVIICTVGVGGRRAWEQDVLIPRKYGIYQPVGDTVMPGGTSRALRMIPAMVDIAEDVLELAPDALFFNYANPMSAICRGVRKATGANVMGACQGVFIVGSWLAAALGVERRRLRYTAIGINHFTPFVEIRLDGRDALPQLQQIATRELARLPHTKTLGTRFSEAGTAQSGEDDDVSPFSWEFLQRFNAFPACRDRHITEFFPALFSREGSYYGRTLGVDCYSFEQTVAHGDRTFAEMRELALSKDPLPEGYAAPRGGEREKIVDIIDSIRTDAGRVYSSNIPNQGQVPNLPRDAVVESPAVADSSGLRPIAQPPLASGVAATLLPKFAWVETVVDAALSGSRDKFVQALIVDGAVNSIDTAQKLADELLQAQAAYLPQFAAKSAQG